MNIKRELVKYGKFLHEKDLVIGSGGNISARDGDAIIIKKRGADMSRDGARGYLRVSLAETERSSGELSTETPLHSICYRSRTDIGAVIHVHSPIMIAAAQRTDLLKNISYEFDCVIGTPVPVLEYLQPGSSALAEAIGEKISSGTNAVMLRRHGAVSVGKNLEEAYLRMLALERACMVWILGDL